MNIAVINAKDLFRYILKFLVIVSITFFMIKLVKRAEEGGRDKNLREKYDIATSRAVANMNTLSEYLMPFVKVKGKMVAMKG